MNGIRLSVKGRAIVVAVTIGLSVGAFAENVWYLSKSWGNDNAANISNLKYYSASETGGEAGPDRAPTTEDCLWVTQARCLNAQNFTTTCKSVTLGDDNTTGSFSHFGGSRTATFSNDGIFLKNGCFFFNGWGDVTIQGKMTVLSTASAPFLINGKQQGQSGKTLTIAGAFIGDVGTCVHFGKGNQSQPANTTFIVNNPSQYKGSIIASAQYALNADTQFGIRLKLATLITTGDLTLQNAGCVLAAKSATDTLTFAHVTIPAGCRIEVPVSGASAGCIKATDGMTIASGTEIKIMAAPEAAGDYVLLEGPATSTFEKDDFTLMGDDLEKLGWLGGELKVVGDATSRRLVLSVAYDCVTLLDAGSKNKDKTGSNGSWYPSAITNASYWSDGKLPHAGAVYVIPADYTLRTPYNSSLCDFPGEKLILNNGSHLHYYGAGMKVKNLLIPAGATAEYWAGQGAQGGYQPLTAESIQIDGELRLGSYNGEYIKLDGPVTGTGMLTMWGVDGSSAYTGRYAANDGALSHFKGQIRISVNPVFGDDRRDQMFTVVRAGDLGAAMDAFDYKGISLERTGKIMVDGGSGGFDFTIPENRGLFVNGEGVLLVPYRVGNLTMESSITITGTLHKVNGSGRLAVKGPMKFFANGEVADTPLETAVNKIILSEGRIEARHCDAFNGAEIHFAATSQNGCHYVQLAADFANADLMRYGFRNTKTDTPFVIDAAASSAFSVLPFRVLWPAQPTARKSFRQAILTVSSAASTSKTVTDIVNSVPLNHYRGFRESRYVEENADGSVTFGVDFQYNGGLLVIIK